jgi:phosphoribosylamine--glycine ligase
VNILVIGSGAREDAIVHSLALEKGHTLHAAPGNPGMARHAALHPIDQVNGRAVAKLARKLSVDLVIIGPEAPLVAGVADAVRKAGIPVFGPSAAAAQLEGSKAFAKQVMQDAGVPTAQAVVTRTVSRAEAVFDIWGAPYVVKDDGLAAGKGVVVTNSLEAALDHVKAVLDAGHDVVIEEYLDGPEISLFCVTDGECVVPLAPAQDFKRALDGDRGPNTGGMGAYSPLNWAPKGLTQQVLDEVAVPTINEMRRRGTPFSGLLYCGLALTKRGLRVVEFNARFGDPETQVVLARLKTPLSEVLMAAAKGQLAALEPLKWSRNAAVTVVIASAGYPGKPVLGARISGIDKAEAVPGVDVLQAGTAMSDAGNLVSAGGRVLSVVGVGKDIPQARERAYEGVAAIRLPGSHHRNDIAATA